MLIVVAIGDTKCVLVDGDTREMKRVAAAAAASVISHDLCDFCPLLQQFCVFRL
jgi:hypothetical protein